MSPAVMDVQSPLTSPPQMQPKQQQSFTPLNPNPNPNPIFPFDSGSNLPEQHRSSNLGFSLELGADEFGELNYGGFVFGVNKSNSDSNSHSEHKESSGGVGELGANVGFVFCANKRSSLTNSDLERRPSSGNVQQLGADEFGELNYEGFVFGAKKSNSVSNKNSEQRASNGSEGQMHADEFRKFDSVQFGSKPTTSVSSSNFEAREPNSVKSESNENGGKSVPIGSQKMKLGAQLGLSDNVGFNFSACLKSSSSISDFKKRESSESSGKSDFEDVGKMKVDIEVGSVVNNKDNFVFGSSVSSTGASGTSTAHKLSDEMKKLTVDDCGKIECSDNAEDPNINSYGSSNHVKDANLKGPGNGSAVEKMEGVNFRTTDENDFVFSSSIDAAGSFGGANLYNGLNKKLEFCEKSISIKDKTGKKTRRKLRQAIPVQQQSRQNCVSKEGSQQNPDSPACYSPMDFSPYHDNSCAPSAVNATSSTCASDEDLAAAREGPNTSEDDKKCRGKHEEVSKNHYERFVAHSSLEEAETECSNLKSEQKTINRGGGVVEDSVNSDRKREESECVKQFCFASSVEDISVRNFTFSVSSAQDNFSATKRQNRKKYRMKVGHGPNCTTPSQKVDTASSSVQSSPLDSGYLHRIRAQDKEGDIFSSQRKGENKSKGGEEHDKKGSTAVTLEAFMIFIRGNQAYEKGCMSEAEEFYTKGINCVLHSEKSGCCVEPLVLCYSNRAAARMSRGRMREALGDCMMAASLDPTFHKVQIRAANNCCGTSLEELLDLLYGFYAAISAAMLCFYSNVVLSGGNPPPKKLKSSAIAPS
ncbi:hypothetical protein LOK49_LG05G02154 [Camellia lanceoleosa]|uniref:Uncharacterized protein n=1 Tax=Camellia lanceoleosa TaxID=1840588 RepID=A0ACC0HQP9_9ERIC|nr:hypothetical protein LOK49_LG05G02154 [Camellia lanceoleosa]